MNKPHIPQSPVPMLTEVVQVNGSLRPAVLPWAAQPSPEPAPLIPETSPSHASDESSLLADKVLERVQAQLAKILPEMMRQAVDQVVSEYVREAAAQQPFKPEK